MTWSDSLPVEICELFASLGQHPETKIAEWVAIKFGNKNERRRAKYAIERYMKTLEYNTMLLQHKASAKQWRLANPSKYRAQKQKITSEKLAARALRFLGLRCEECGAPIPFNARNAPVPKFCGTACNAKCAGRAYFRRRHPKQRIKVRSWGEKRRMGLL